MTAPSKGLSDFVAEATETVESLSKDLLTLDENRGEEPDPGVLNGIFRAAHSLKGLSALFGQDRISQLAHRGEDLLDRLRLGRVAATDDLLDALIESVDVFQALLAETSRGRTTDALTARALGLSNRMAALAGEAPESDEDPLDRLALEPNVRAVLTEYEEHRLRQNVKKGVSLWKVRAAFDLSDFDQGLAALNARLKPLGEVVSTLPSSEPGSGTGIAFDLLVGSKAGHADLEASLKDLPAVLTAIPANARPAPQLPSATTAVEPAAALVETPSGPTERGRAELDAASTPPVALVPSERDASAAPLEPSLRSLTQTVRVDIDRLDRLMNAVGELLLIKANVQRLAETARQPGVHVVAKLWGQELGRESRQLERKLDELQKGILEVRMVPLGQVFDKLARLVRRIAREAAKEIDFSIGGGDVELDKLIVEELSDPLMHIIRNAIDHGIEQPDRRESLGKPRRGKVALRARTQGAHVVIEIKDDGAGIDHERIREVAIQRGLITGAQADELGRRELLNLIFLPGFSTARSVSELSGRGVGLDVVKTNIAHLSGIIDVDTALGQGTTLTLTLPVTLAIIRALVVSVSDRLYAVPLNSVLEIISVRDDEIRTVERREVVTLRGRTLPLLRLARHFGLPEKPQPRHFIVVVGLAQQRLGIVLDDLAGQQDIVAKPLGGRLRNVRGVSGATDLGNRRTVLVLDVGALVEEVVAPERRAEFL